MNRNKWHIYGLATRAYDHRFNGEHGLGGIYLNVRDTVDPRVFCRQQYISVKACHASFEGCLSRHNFLPYGQTF